MDQQQPIELLKVGKGIVASNLEEVKDSIIKSSVADEIPYSQDIDDPND